MKHGCTNSGCTGESMTGHCGGCNGCGTCWGRGELILCQEEVLVLLELAQIAFLPIIQTTENGTSKYVSTPDYRKILPENFSEIIISLKEKHLVTIDPDIPLNNTEYGSLDGFKHVRCGSLALTLQGQEALDWISPSEFSQ